MAGSGSVSSRWLAGVQDDCELRIETQIEHTIGTVRRDRPTIVLTTSEAVALLARKLAGKDDHLPIGRVRKLSLVIHVQAVSAEARCTAAPRIDGTGRIFTEVGCGRNSKYSRPCCCVTPNPRYELCSV